jgi:hypothetical protein
MNQRERPPIGETGGLTGDCHAPFCGSLTPIPRLAIRRPDRAETIIIGRLSCNIRLGIGKDGISSNVAEH